MSSLIALLLYILTSSAGMILIKLGGKDVILKINSTQFMINFPTKFVMGIFLYSMSFILWTYILQKFTITYISPIAYGITFVVLSILSYYFLGEAFSKNHFIGAIFIIIGILIATFK